MEARCWQAEATEAVWSGQGQSEHYSDHVSNNPGQLRVKCLPTVNKVLSSASSTCTLCIDLHPPHAHTEPLKVKT